VALCDESGRPRSVFNPGEVVRFFYEYELLERVDVPIGNVVIWNEQNIVVHGKASLYFPDLSLPRHLEAGQRVRFRQSVKLDLAPVAYTYGISFGVMADHDYERSRHMTQEAQTKLIRGSHDLRNPVGTFQVIYDPDQGSAQYHHGICNLAGDVTVDAVQSAVLVS
jgi:hypothetical protein